MATTPSPTPLLEIFCVLWPFDRPGQQPFSVDLANTETVDDLKSAIKLEQTHRLKDIDAPQLELYRVSIPDDDDILLQALRVLNFDGNGIGAKELNATAKLSKVFPDGVEDDRVHIVARKPGKFEGHIKPQHLLTMFILYHLFPGVSRADVLRDREHFLHELIHRINSDLSSIDGDLHQGRTQYLKNHTMYPPPEQGFVEEVTRQQKEENPAFHFNRPPSAASTIPITLFHPVFGQFQDDCEAYETTAEDHAFVLEFSRAMSRFYDTEDQRLAEARDILANYGLTYWT